MNKGDRKFYKIFLAVFGLLIFLNFIGILRPFSNFLVSKATIFSSYFNESSKDYLDEKKKKSELLKEVDYLKKQLELKKVDMALIESLRQENREFRDFFNFVDDLDYSYLTAKIIWSQNLINLSSVNQNLVVNRGEKDGVVPGLAVLSDSGILVGKVLEVEDNYSEICLVTNSFCRFAVSLSNENKSSGLSIGNLGLSVSVDFIPQTEILDIADIVFTSGLEILVPRGLYLGEVIDFTRRENDIWQNVVVEPFFELSRLNNLIIVIP